MTATYRNSLDKAGDRQPNASLPASRPVSLLAFGRPVEPESRPSFESGAAAASDTIFLELARSAYQARRQRGTVFGVELFADPAWDLLLDLFIAGEEKRNVSVKSACLAASVPATTALRYIAHLVKVGLVNRRPHPTDCRSTHVRLTATGRQKMVEYFSRVPEARGAAGA